MLFKKFFLAIILIPLSFLSGCGNNGVKEQSSWQKDAFCYNGGRQHNYSCDPSLAALQPDMHPEEIDEIWMYSKLWEIKAWLKQLNVDASTRAPLYVVKVTPYNDKYE